MFSGSTASLQGFRIGRRAPTPGELGNPQYAAFAGANGGWLALPSDKSADVQGYFVEFTAEPPASLRLSGVKQNPSNGHYYEARALDGANGWDLADVAAGNLFYKGLRGHLATVTDAAEQLFLEKSFHGVADFGWIGASDADQEGEWRWVAGPESGQLFWDHGTAVGFNDWAGGEPNDIGGEDYAGWNWWGHSWNDAPIWWTGLFIVEYSAVPEPPAVMLAVLALTCLSVGAFTRTRHVRRARRACCGHGLRSAVCLATIAGLAPRLCEADPVLDPATGHYYEFVPGNVSWADANAAAAQRSFAGHKGYLATITNAAEEALALSLAPSASLGWLGATDDGASGEWRWISGPDKDVRISEVSSRETVRPLSFADWAVEPVLAPEAGVRFAALETTFSGRREGWWDLAPDSSVSGYWVEYSDTELPIYNASTGGYLQFVRAPGISWDGAAKQAQALSFQGLSGRLATVASMTMQGSLQNDFTNVGTAWIGAADPAGNGSWRWAGAPSENDVFWQGSAGQARGFQNWQSGEPAASVTNEPRFGVWRGGDDGKWVSGDASSAVEGFFVEFAPETGQPKTIGQPKYNAANGHVYQLMQLPSTEDLVNWDRADYLASHQFRDGLRGHLATITSQGEQDFIDNSFGGSGGAAWIAASDALNEGEWRWVAGPETGQIFWKRNDPIGYANWGGGEPNDLWIEDHAAWNWGGGTWNDAPIWWGVNRMLVEFSPGAGDANSDGVVDLTDFGALKQNFGTGTKWSEGDLNGDGAIDLSDFGILKEAFGGATLAASVPEPSTNLLAILAIGGCVTPWLLSRRTRVLRPCYESAIWWREAGTTRSWMRRE
ncbi:MAG: lectin-like protein [Pirellulales bacterium]